MKVSHNIQSMNAIRLVNINIESYAKSTEQISSGYKINRGVDYPAGLGISEMMRRQARGLTQATNNAKDGVAFVQIADGAMNEIHDMLQRMNELALKSLNGLYTDSDRIALNVEFDQLRTEFDRINKTTEFGTGIPVFEEHEPSYYQIFGNRRWDDNQLHTISSMANALNIHLPDGYEPKDYTITVPAGVYTTQELIDEIDDALSNMVPPNPGFVFELTSDGYCNLNFERADGAPTKIDFVDGSLAYLLYDFDGGMGSNDILGTTIFEVDQKLIIVNGKNDELSFYLEGAADVKENPIKIKISEGSYTREQLIDKINAFLPTKSGVVAVPYGDYCIQITSGSDVAITGLSGNMFKYEETSPIYTSIFYDNVKYGTCSKWPATIIGQHNELPIRISAENNNNKLHFKLNDANDASDYIELTIDDGEYTVWQLADTLNGLFKDKLEMEAGVYYYSYPSLYPCLSLSSTMKGENSSLVFDTSEACYENTYKTLFFSTSEYPDNITGDFARVVGFPDISKGISLGENEFFVLRFGEDSEPYPFYLNQIYLKKDENKDYYTLDNLIDALMPQVEKHGLKDKIKFTSTGSNLVIEACNSDVKSISIVDMSDFGVDTDQKLFAREIMEPQGSFKQIQSGSKKTDQGTTNIDLKASTIVTSSACKDPVIIDDNSNTITFNITGPGFSTQSTITIESETYTLSELASKINSKLGANSRDQYLQNMEAVYYGDGLQFIFRPTETLLDGSWNISIPFNSREDALNNSIWKKVFETEAKSYISSRPATPATITTTVPLDTNIKIDETNSALTLSIGGVSADLILPPGTYTHEELQEKLQDAINDSDLNGIVSVTVLNGKISLTADRGKFELMGTFYNEIMSKGMCSNYASYIEKGGYNYDPAFIIGRQDLTVDSIEIISGSNDIFTFDFTHNNKKTTISVEIEEGIYNGNTLADVLEQLIQDKFNEMGRDDLEVDVSIGGHDTKLPNTNDSTALQITLNKALGKEPDEGEYIIDGIRGSAANSIFYKSTTTPTMTYIVGTKNIREGISFEPGKNVLTLSANSVPYQYTFDKPYYTANEFLDALNSMFENGDDNGNPAPLRASIDKSGALKLSYTVAGANTITDIGGSGRSSIFFEEEGRDSRDPLVLQLGSEANETMEIPRISVSSVALGINSITISKEKYAEKAIIRIKDAINLLSSKRSIYGAIQNRLEHTINSNNNVIECIQASDSRLRDTDVSSEMIRFSNLNILLQVGQKMLSQSNQNIEKLLNLL